MKTFTPIFRCVLTLSIVLSLITFAAPPQKARAAAILYVNPNNTADPTCGSWDNACLLLVALTQAQSGDEIWVMQGIHWLGAGRTATFALKDGVAVYGGFVGTETARDQRDWQNNVTRLTGADLYHVVTVAGDATPATILDGFTISGGIANDTTHGYGGGLITNGGSPTLRNLTFSQNYAMYDGGGLYNPGGSPALTNVTFSENSTGANGGGMYTFSGTVTLTNVAFTANSATINGGGLYSDRGQPVLTQVTFNGNTATVRGGGMFNYVSNPTLSATFNNNYAGAEGGGLYNVGGSPVLTGAMFNHNTAHENGGGIYNYESAPTLSQFSFYSNTAATGDGGGMYNYASNPILDNGAFMQNRADDEGGAMYNTASSPTLTFINISYNTAFINGGGMYNANKSRPALTSTLFTHNNSSNGGGGGMYNDDSSPTMTSVTLTLNIAQGGGGGIFNANGSSPTLHDITVEQNEAFNASGGGISNNASNPTLENVTFSRNFSMHEHGGGMANVNSTPRLTNTTFISNTATEGYGGGVYNSSSFPILTHATFSNNSATSGGGIYNTEGSTTTVQNSIMWGGTPDELHDTDTSTFLLYSSDIQGGCSIYDTCVDVRAGDPRLGVFGDYGGHTAVAPILEGSAARDAANDASCPATDQRGVARPQGPHCDMGAFEVEVGSPPVYLYLPLVARDYHYSNLPQPPLAPSDLQLTPESPTRIALSWTDHADNESGFEIERAPVSSTEFALIATVISNTTAYADTGLTPATAYIYRVRAVGATGRSDYCPAQTASTLPAPATPPAAPSGLGAANITASSAYLTWTDNSNDETGFRITMRQGAGAYQLIGTLGENVTAATITDLAGGTAYTFQVTAYNGAGESAPSNEAPVTTLSDVTAARFINNASYPVVSLIVDGVQQFPQSPWGILPGEYYEIPLDAGSHIYEARTGFWQSDTQRFEMYIYTGSFTQVAGVVTEIAIDDITLVNLLTQFQEEGYWEGWYMDANSNCHTAAFRFYRDETWRLYDGNVEVGTGFYSLVLREPDIFAVKFKVTDAPENEGLLMETYGYFTMNNGPNSWKQIEYTYKAGGYVYNPFCP